MIYIPDCFLEESVRIAGGVFFHEFGDCVAVKTLAVVDGDYTTARFTSVQMIQFFDQCLDTTLPEGFQVLNHTHMIIISISLIHALDVLTGILLTLETEGSIAFRVPVQSGAFPK
jgi:hypothetical protein